MKSKQREHQSNGEKQNKLTWRGDEWGARKVCATERESKRLKKKNQNLLRATRTCGQESKPNGDVAPDSGLNGSKSNSSCIHSISNFRKNQKKKKNKPQTPKKTEKTLKHFQSVTNEHPNLQTTTETATATVSRVFSDSFCFCLDPKKMQETKDPAIKLFGQKIPLPGEAEGHAISGDETASPPAMDVDKKEEEEEERNFAESEAEEEEKDIGDKDPQGENVTEKKKEADPPPNAAENKNDNNSGIQNPKTPSIEEETAKSENPKPENEQTDDATTTNNNPQEKTLKKPDKILPCPRCNSMDTKFCYYNNYNINQPRYFCKACQRYWTAGGTMRNVPVGAGRRKNKNSSSHYHHITISEALQAARIGAPNGTTHHHVPSLKTNGRVLSFGLEHPPICDSMATFLNLAEKKKTLNGTKRNGFHSTEETKFPVSGGENGDDCSSLSSITGSNSMEKSGKNASKESLQQPNNGFLPQVPCISSVPWPYPWSSAVPSPPAMCPPGFPMPFYPAAFWNVPWFPSHPYAPNPMPPSSGGPNSPTLGKHSRDDDGDDIVKQDDMRKEESPRQRNGCVLIPKTLRIDDPSEAAKSSIWATLGIKNECVSKKGGMIKAFESKKGEKNHVVETSPVLMANPAALSRSLNFHENS